MINSIIGLVLIISKYVYEFVCNSDQVILYCIDSTILTNLMYVLRFHIGLSYCWLLDIYCIDFFSQLNRFCITWLIHNFYFRIFVRILVTELTLLPSCVHIYNGAGWLEREVFDMFGIFFYHNVDLRRILTDYGFVGYPLRNDFPLTGFIEVRYDDFLKRIVMEPVFLSQEFSFFEFLSPWVSGMYV